MNILSIGDNCIDVYINKNKAYPGGGCVNFSVYTAQLGHKLTYIGALSNDKPGKYLAESIQKEKVNIKKIQYYKGDTALAFVKLNNSDREFIGSDRGVRSLLDGSKIGDDYIKQFKLIHTTLDGKIDNYIPKWKNDDNYISYDFSNRAKDEQIDLLPYIDFAFFSGDNKELEKIKDKAQSYFNKGAKIVVITRGENGSIAYDGTKFYIQKAKEVTPIDTLGCGDAFISAFIDQYLKKKSIKLALKAGTNFSSKILNDFGAFGYGISPEKIDINIDNHNFN